jgi:putative oxidoreductase
MKKNADVGQLVLRVALGLLFIIPGISKLMDTSMITGMIAGMGLPMAGVLAWIVLLAEIIFGIAVLIGWRTQWTPIPLIVIIVVGIFLAFSGVDMSNPMTIMNVLWHFLGLAALLSVMWSGPGGYRIKS